MRWWTLLIGVVVWTWAQSAMAAVQRYAVVIGNNWGHGGDAELRYAESDAAKMAKTLREVGDFEPADIVLLRGEDAATVRRTLIAVNDRIRSTQALLDSETVLFVYFSGHADAQALRLGPTRFEFRELAQLVRGSSAKFRILLVDACRSGALTRVKGGTLVAPFDIVDAPIETEGLAFLTASSANEDAQESDELKGSFFTHAFVSGLLGAADRDHDGAVQLDEAYDYAYDATLGATSRTYRGPQHPTFQFELKGQKSIILTRPQLRRAGRAQLSFPIGTSYLVLTESERGAVVGEVSAGAAARSLSVVPGKYFIRGRGKDFLLETTVSVGAGQDLAIRETELMRVEYAVLVRKGASERAYTHGVSLGTWARTALPSSPSGCIGTMLGYRVDFASLGIDGRFGFCSSSFENSTLKARTNEYELRVGVDHTWDFGHLGLFAGAGLGSRTVHQTFDTLGRAPSRVALAATGYLSVGVTETLWHRLYWGVEGVVEGHLYRFQPSTLSAVELRASPAVRGGLWLGYHL